MTELSAAAAAAYRTARDIRGVQITVQRLTGQAPMLDITSATVKAVLPETILASGDPNGETVALDRRVFIVLTADLAAAGFPVPVRKNDRVLVGSETYKMDVTNVDAEKRAIAGAIEITAVGAT